jgi:peptidoglycan hydrolase-like protein with peptidoglycan-binding domain
MQSGNKFPNYIFQPKKNQSKMKLIKPSSQGLEVKHWQAFLKQHDFMLDDPTGVFDENTRLATAAFQASNNLNPDSEVGKNTLKAAAELGFVDIFSPNFPDVPPFTPLRTIADKASMFGRFDFRANPLPDNKENIEILGSWEDDNIVIIDIPQLIPVKGNPKARFHKMVADKAIKLFADWENAGLADRILSWDGAYVPRFIRGSTTALSQHAFGSAFDINVEWNGLNAVPAAIGQKGAVRELVQIAHENGFFWGGHFSRLDGMHFELAVLDPSTASRDMMERGLEDVYDAEGQDLY